MYREVESDMGVKNIQEISPGYDHRTQDRFLGKNIAKFNKRANFNIRHFLNLRSSKFRKNHDYFNTSFK